VRWSSAADGAWHCSHDARQGCASAAASAPRACHHENNHDRRTNNSYIRVLELEQGSFDLERLLLEALRWAGKLRFGDGPVRTLARVLRITVLVNLFMLGSELFAALYSGGTHASAVEYLFFGSHGKHALVPYMWSALALNVASVVLLHVPRSRSHKRWLLAGCACAFAGVYLEKGMGLIVPGFVPSTLHELVEYTPTATEWKISAGIWAFGALVLTAGLKAGLAVWTGRVARPRP
jgi:molybdopterin-containing oxidoreductase family membrane subunit